MRHRSDLGFETKSVGSDTIPLTPILQINRAIYPGAPCWFSPIIIIFE